MVPTEGVEPTHSHEYQILSLARLPIPPRRQPKLRGLKIGLHREYETCDILGVGARANLKPQPGQPKLNLTRYTYTKATQNRKHAIRERHARLL